MKTLLEWADNMHCLADGCDGHYEHHTNIYNSLNESEYVSVEYTCNKCKHRAYVECEPTRVVDAIGNTLMDFRTPETASVMFAVSIVSKLPYIVNCDSRRLFEVIKQIHDMVNTSNVTLDQVINFITAKGATNILEAEMALDDYAHDLEAINDVLTAKKRLTELMRNAVANESDLVRSFAGSLIAEMDEWDSVKIAKGEI